MLLTLGLLFVVGLALGAACARLGLPRLVGMMAAGLLLGPHALNLIDAGTLAMSADLRELALIVILLRAGLSLDLAGLRRVGRPALMMACVPALCEIAGYALLGGALLGLSTLEGALLGAVMGAVSPAVVVPGMVGLIERGLGRRNSVPQLVIAGASIDDVFVIVVFTALLSMAQGGAVSAWSFAGIPTSIALGIALGAAAGLALSALVGRWHMRDSAKVVLMLGCACLMAALEELLKGRVPISGLLAVMAVAAALRRGRPAVAERLAAKFSKVWIAAEIALFALVGAQVDPALLAQTGAGAGRVAEHRADAADAARADLLRDCVHAQGHSAGRDRRRAAGGGAGLRRAGAGDSADRAAGRAGDTGERAEAAGLTARCRGERAAERGTAD